MNVLLNEARSGWDGKECQWMVGSPNWMAWRAGGALKNIGRGRPIGVTLPRPSAGPLKQQVYVDILPSHDDCWTAWFLLKENDWTLDKLSSSRQPPSFSSRVMFWLQRRGLP